MYFVKIKMTCCYFIWSCSRVGRPIRSSEFYLDYSGRGSEINFMGAYISVFKYHCSHTPLKNVYRQRFEVMPDKISEAVKWLYTVSH